MCAHLKTAFRRNSVTAVLPLRQGLLGSREIRPAEREGASGR